MAENNDEKKFWKSKTFWVNIISAIAVIIQSKTGFMIDPIMQALGISALNTGLAVAKNSKV